MRKTWLLTVLVTIMALSLSRAYPQGTPSQNLEPYRTIVAVAKKTLPSVVDIDVVVPEETLPAQILGAARRGTGVLVDKEGNIVTASHVILGASKVVVTLTGGQKLPAKMIGIDNQTGLGLIKVEGKSLKSAALGRSATAQVGELALVIGGTGEGHRVVNSGIVSSLRPFVGYWEYMLEQAIYTNAPITAGFSGGPLINAEGQVIGIISFSNSQAQNENIAIPIDLFHQIKADLIAYGEPRRAHPQPWFGLSSVPIKGGVLVTGVTPGGPAARAGLQPKDIIFQLNSQGIPTQREFYQLLWKGKVGDEVTLSVKRDEEDLTVKMRPTTRPQYLIRNQP